MYSCRTPRPCLGMSIKHVALRKYHAKKCIIGNWLRCITGSMSALMLWESTRWYVAEEAAVQCHDFRLLLQAYQIYFPLTRNTNVNNIRAAGSNVTTEAYMTMPSDCQYGSATVSTASVGSSARYDLNSYHEEPHARAPSFLWLLLFMGSACLDWPGSPKTELVWVFSSDQSCKAGWTP